MHPADDSGATGTGGRADFARVGRGALLLMGGQYASLLLALASIGLVTRLLGPGGYGLFSFVFAFAALATSLSTFGSLLLSRYAVEHLALGRAGQAKDVFMKALVLMAGAGGVSAAALFLLSRFLESGLYVAALIPYVAATLVATPFHYLFFSQERFGLFTLGTVLPALLLLPLLWLLRELGLWGVVLAYDLSALLPLALLAVMAAKTPIGHARREAAPQGYRHLFAGSLWVLLSNLLPNARARVGVLLLAHYAFLHGLAETGYFNLALSLVLYASTALGSMGDATGPTLTRRYATGDRRGLADAFWEASRYIALLAVPLALLLVPLGEPATALLFRREFGPAGQNLALVALVLLLVGAVKFSRTSFILRERFGLLAVGEAAGLAATVPLALLLIPPFASLGASAAFLAGSAASAAVHLFNARRLGFPVSLAPVPRFLVAGTPFLLLLLVPRSLELLLPAVGGAFVLYLLLLRLQGLFRWEDVRRVLGVALGREGGAPPGEKLP